MLQGFADVAAGTFSPRLNNPGDDPDAGLITTVGAGRPKPLEVLVKAGASRCGRARP